MFEEPTLPGRVFAILLALLPWGLWTAWWLCGVDWKKMGPVLREGAWAPVILLMLIAAAVWSQLAPAACNCLPFVTIPNFFWQLGSVVGLALVALFCGWLQGVFGWAPQPVSVEPPAHGHAHDHGHEGHSHDDHSPAHGQRAHGQGHGRHQ